MRLSNWPYPPGWISLRCRATPLQLQICRGESSYARRNGLQRRRVPRRRQGHAAGVFWWELVRLDDWIAATYSKDRISMLARKYQTAASVVRDAILAEHRMMKRSELPGSNSPATLAPP